MNIIKNINIVILWYYAIIYGNYFIKYKRGSIDMKNYKDIFWVIPLYCVIAGILSFHIVIAMIARFAIMTLPDGTITSDDTKTEIFVSASILVLFQFVITLIQCCIGKMTLTTALVFMYLSQISEWSSIVSLLLFKVTNHIYIGEFVKVFAPYIFVLFGLKNIEKNEEQIDEI